MMSVTQQVGAHIHEANKFRRITPFLVAAIYSVTLASLPVDVFSDRVNYLNYATYAWVLFIYRWNEGWLPLLTNEPLWLLFNALLATFLQPEAVVRAVILCSSAIVAWHITRNCSKPLWVVFLVLLFPMVVRYHITALRNGLALAVFLTGWYSTNKGLRWGLMCTAPLIHVSYFVVLALLGIARLCVVSRLAADLRVVVFATFALFYTQIISVLARLVGARQAQQYAFTSADFSGLGLLFWIAVFLLMGLQGRRFLREHAFETGSIVFYAVSVWFVEIAARAFESVVPLIVLANLHLTSWRYKAFIVLLIGHLTLYFILNASRPWLGFGR